VVVIQVFWANLGFMELSQNTTETAARVAGRSKLLRSATTNGNRPFVLGGDGRGAWVRRWRDLVELHTADCGGTDALSEAMLSMIRRISAIEVQLEQMEARMSEGDLKVDLDLYNRLAGNLRRMLESIGLQRVARPVNDGSQILADHFSRSPKEV
jgi:hypothetical protein